MLPWAKLVITKEEIEKIRREGKNAFICPRPQQLCLEQPSVILARNSNESGLLEIHELRYCGGHYHALCRSLDFPETQVCIQVEAPLALGAQAQSDIPLHAIVENA